MEDSQEFSEMIFNAWVEASAGERAATFEALGSRVVEARRQYEAAKQLDEKLFGDEFVTG